MPDDDNDPRMPPPQGYVPPPNFSLNQPQPLRQVKPIDPLLGVPQEFRGKNVKTESKPAEKRVVAKPPSTPLPKMRPDDARKDSGPAVASGPIEPKTIGSVPSPENKTKGETSGELKKAPESSPVQRLE